MIVAALLAACLIGILLAILWASSKIIVRVIKEKLSPDNVHDISVSD